MDNIISKGHAHARQRRRENTKNIELFTSALQLTSPYRDVIAAAVVSNDSELLGPGRQLEGNTTCNKRTLYSVKGTARITTHTGEVIPL